MLLAEVLVASLVVSLTCTFRRKIGQVKSERWKVKIKTSSLFTFAFSPAAMRMDVQECDATAAKYLYKSRAHKRKDKLW